VRVYYDCVSPEEAAEDEDRYFEMRKRHYAEQGKEGR
jgi:hypothetical protein